MSIFNKIPIPSIRRSKFNLSHEVKLSTEIGRLTPFLCQDVLPGDTWTLTNQILVRLAPMFAPIMHSIDVFTDYFFVPYRLIWDKDELEKFFTGGKDGMQTAEFPTLPITDLVTDAHLLDASSLADYLGVPTKRSDSRPNDLISALPFRAYQRVYEDNYKDENLMPEFDVPTHSGVEDDFETIERLMTIKNVCWEKDYFTSALPFLQRGEEVRLPMLGNADVLLRTNKNAQKIVGQTASVQDLANTNLIAGNNTAAGSQVNILAGGQQGTSIAFLDPNGSMYVNGASFSSATINELRKSVAVQRYLEALSRGGYRYKEFLASVYGEMSSDRLLDRPQFIGRIKSPVIISEVLQQSAAVDNQDYDTVLGSMAGHGISSTQGKIMKFSSEEHGILLGLVFLRPRTSYMNGLPRMFKKFDRYDFGLPQLANIGEQEVFNYEIYWNANEDESQFDDLQVFGYQSRYSEYKYIPSSFHGTFRESMLNWHLGRVFDSPPALNSEFVTVQSQPNDRIFNVTDSSFDHVWMQVGNQITCKRKLPYFATGGSINL